MDSPTSDKMSEETVSDNKKSSHRRTTSSVTTNEVASMKMIQTEPEEVAIKLDKAYKSYGSRKHKHPVLMGLDMEVGKGHIYGLLGPSGCGKTTLLNCIIGKYKLDDGSVNVFGEPPGPNAKSGVPGSRVGYMPQELALFLEFSIEETLIYFARLYGMSRAKFKERLAFLMKFLDLPSSTRILQNMSGGQQRRASLAVALIHEPELLILDEPTVGVDPLLRTSIWKHLVDICDPNLSTRSTTIVITTHYIEEARAASRVGMMRSGKLLAEGAPDDLIAKYQKPTLEEIFLGLCMQDGDLDIEEDSKPIIKVKKESNAELVTDKPTKSDDHPLIPKDEKLNGVQIVSNGNAKHNNNSDKQMKNKKVSSLKKVQACTLKTFNRMKRRIGFLIYQFVLPAIQVSLFCLAIGQDPKELPVAIVNAENNGMACDFSGNFSKECPMSLGTFGMPESNEHLANFTCRYLSFIDTKVAHLVYYNDLNSAIQSVEDGHSWGVISMNQNFTQNLYERVLDSMSNTDLNQVDVDLMEKSSIKVHMDVTNQHIAFTLQLKFVEAFEAFTKQLFSVCKLPEELASLPLVFEEPIYGTHDLTFTDFMAPGIILTIVHSMALAYSAIIIIMERNEGLVERTWVAGVTPGEFALSHFLVSLVVNFLQVIVTLVFMIVVFKVPNEGSFFWVFILTMLQGVSGTTIGLIISAVCKTQQDATQIALGIFYPNMILSGIIWPVESMPTALRYIAYVLPQTFACEAMRGILLRGWGLSYMPVWRGFLVTIAWIVGTYAIFKKMVKQS